MLTSFDTDPKTDPAQEETLRTDSCDMVTEVTMTLSIYSIMEKPAKRQRTESLDLPSIYQVKPVQWLGEASKHVCFGSTNFQFQGSSLSGGREKDE